MTNQFLGFVEEPKFSFVERDDVVIKFNKSTVNGVQKKLYICCLGSKNVPAFINKWLCRGHTKCPRNQFVDSCQLHGNIVWCNIKYVKNNTMLRGYVVQIDEKNNTVTSKVATYVTRNSGISD